MFKRYDCIPDLFEISLLLVIGLVEVSVIARPTSDPTERIRYSSDASGSTRSAPARAVCRTQGCITVANIYLSLLNTTVDPCDDFYEFMCANWVASHPIPDNQGSTNLLSVTQTDISLELKALFESSVPSDSPKFLKLAPTYYKACMDSEKREAARGQPLISELKSYGKWPIFEPSWNESSFDLTTILIKLLPSQRLLFTMRVEVSMVNALQYIPTLWQLTLPLKAREYYLDSVRFGEQLQSYKAFVQSYTSLILTDAQIQLSGPEIQMLAEEILHFEIELAKIARPRREMTGLDCEVLPIHELNLLVPQIDWMRLLLALAPAGFVVGQDYAATVCNPSYFARLAQLLQRTSNRTIANFLLWQFSLTNWNDLDHRFSDLMSIFTKLTSGQEKNFEPWEMCAYATNTYFDLAAGAQFARHHIDASTREEVQNMAKRVRQSLKELIDKIKWLESKDKEVAYEKIEKMVDHVGYPDVLLNETVLEEHYKDLDLQPDEPYYTMVVKVTTWMYDKRRGHLSRTHNRQSGIDNGVRVTQPNAFYHPQRNSQEIEGGILRQPFVDINFPKSFNYGGLGFVISHEITHAFDEVGRSFDQYGNMRQWWSNETAQKFAERTKCFVEMLNSYTIASVNMTIDGALTANEVIADHGGLQVAFQTYQKAFEDDHDEDYALPGLEQYSKEQMFFFATGHILCGHSRQQELIMRGFMDRHPEPKVRLNALVGNTPEFINAFSCSSHDPVYRKEKCSLWT